MINDTTSPLLSFLAPHIYEDTRMRLWDMHLDNVQLPGSAFGLARFTLGPGCTSPVDSHQSHEIWLVVSGQGELIYNGQVQPLEQNVACYLEPTKEHQVRNTGDQDFTAISVWWRT